jgi:hypothetical protein
MWATRPVITLQSAPMRAAGVGLYVKSKVLNTVLDEVPNKLLYHYTDQKGLLGIITSKEIWATHHQCLNDTQEFLYAKELVRKELKKRISANDGSRSLLATMSSALDGPGNEDVNLYVASFSEEPDSLAQWRAYGGASSGFALGFQCERFVLPEAFALARCIYQPEKQSEVVDAIVSEVLDRSEQGGLLNTEKIVRVILLFALHAFALILKHPKFAEEREWRIVSRVMMDDAPAFPIEDANRLEFRVGKSMLIPYRCISVKDGSGSFLLKRIIVGPNPNPEQAHRSVRSLLKSKKDTKAVEVQSSDIPYRNW